MTVFEQHLLFNQRVQEIASYKKKKFKPEEVDLLLNKAMFRLLEQGVNNKFQDDQLNLSHVRALIHKNKIEEVIIPATTDKLYEENNPNYYAIVPPDFYWLINARVETIHKTYDCDSLPSLGTTSKPEYVSVVAFPSLGSPPYFSATSVSSSTLGSLYTSPTEITAGFDSSRSKYVVVQNIIEYFYRKYTTIKVYWERYRDVYYKDSFVFVGNVNIGTMTVTSGGQSRAVASTLTNYPIYNRALIGNLSAVTVEVTSTRISQGEELYSALKQNKYYNTRRIEPVLDQLQDFFVLYRDGSFIISRLYFDYIRKPRTISLTLNQDCELADTTHQRVVDLAVELAKLDTNNPGYPATVQDTQLRTV